MIAAAPISMPTPPDPWWGWTIADLDAWPLAIGIVLGAIACTRAVRPSRREWLAITMLFLGALALRLLLGIWAPVHINGQGPLWIGAAAGRPSMLVGYGPGYAELYAAIVRDSTTADVAIFAANAIMSACAPVLVLALGRLAGLALDRAVFAALIFVVDPIAVRTSASESYFVPIVLLVLAASVAITASVRVRPAWRRALLLGAAAMFAIQVARIHPVAWVPLALAPLAAILPPPISWRRIAWVAIAATAIAIAIATTSAGWIAMLGVHASHYGDGISHQLGRAWVLVPIALAFVLVRSPRWPLVAVATVALVADAILRPVYGQGEVWQASFDRLLLAIPVLAIAATIPEGLFGPRARWLLAIAVVAFAIVRGASLPLPTTEQLEYRWLHGELAQLDPQCRVASISRAGQRVHYLPWYVMDGAQTGPTPTRWLTIRDPRALVEATRSGRCLVWVHASICESSDGTPQCAAIERAAPMEEIASVELPAVPSADPYPYDNDAVRVSLHRVLSP